MGGSSASSGTDPTLKAGFLGSVAKKSETGGRDRPLSQGRFRPPVFLPRRRAVPREGPGLFQDRFAVRLRVLYPPEVRQDRGARRRARGPPRLPRVRWLDRLHRRACRRRHRLLQGVTAREISLREQELPVICPRPLERQELPTVRRPRWSTSTGRSASRASGSSSSASSSAARSPSMTNSAWSRASMERRGPR